MPKLGQLISVFGKVSEFREERQLTILSICPEEDPNAESLFWLEVTHLKKHVYIKPFVLPDGVEGDPKNLVQSTLDLRKALMAEIKSCLKRLFLGKTFSLAQLNSDEGFLQACLESIGSVYPNIAKQDVSQQLSSIIKELPTNGLVILSGGGRRFSRDAVYKVMFISGMHERGIHCNPHTCIFMG